MKKIKILLAIIVALFGNMALVHGMNPARLITKAIKIKPFGPKRSPKDTSRINDIDEDGHTVLYDAIIDKAPGLHINMLRSEGAKLNDCDIDALGHSGYLGFLVNSFANPCIVNTVKVFRSFMTKNTDAKLDYKVALGKITSFQRDAIVKLKGTMTNLYNNAVSGECLLLKREEGLAFNRKVRAFKKQEQMKAANS